MECSGILSLLGVLGFHESHEILPEDTHTWVQAFSYWITVDKHKLEYILDRICLHPINSMSINTDFICIWGDVDLVLKFDWCARQQQLKTAQAHLLKQSHEMFGLAACSAFNPDTCSVSMPTKKVIKQIEATNWRISFLRACLWVISHLTNSNPSLKIMLHQSLLRSLRVVISDSRWTAPCTTSTATIEDCINALVNMMQTNSPFRN